MKLRHTLCFQIDRFHQSSSGIVKTSNANYHSHASTNNTATPDKITYTIAPNTTVGGIATPPITITVNQQQNGGRWNLLTSLDLNTANPLTVTLSGQGNGAVIADAIRIVPNTPSQTQSTSYYIHTDHLNTPRVIVNTNNQRRWTWYPEQAEAFGANRPNENPTNLINGTPTQLGSFSYHLRFPGQLFDPATGLIYNYFRDYNPRTGRFPESDPIGLAGGQVSTYTYVNGNPLWWVDPEGLAGGPATKGTYYPKGNKPTPATPSTNDPGNTEDTLGVGARGAGCMFSFLSEAAAQACMPMTCVQWLCTPSCGEPYRVYKGQHSFTDPDTKCKCEVKIHDINTPVENGL